MSIEISNLTRTYGSQIAVDRLSFKAGDNEIVGFLGPNGAGKSTTMKIITGYLKADEGTVLVNGIDVNNQPLEAKKQVGYLPEGNPLYHDMYVKEYLAFIAALHGIKNPVGRIQEVITMTGLQPESHKKTGQLSKGYKQRVGLAAALIHDPEVLILDEPTSGLDPNQIIEIRQLIRELASNKTVLFSSHILQEVESICDRVIIINKGKMVANDTIQNLRSGNRNKYIVLVEFGTAVPQSAISEMESVESVTVDEGKYHIQTSDPERLKKLLLEYSLNNNADILSLQSKSHSLEEVFRQLTGNSITQ